MTTVSSVTNKLIRVSLRTKDGADAGELIEVVQNPKAYLELIRGQLPPFVQVDKFKVEHFATEEAARRAYARLTSKYEGCLEVAVPRRTVH
jgi:hypothetical protein